MWRIDLSSLSRSIQNEDKVTTQRGCFQRYHSHKKLASLSHELRKDMGIMQDSFEVEVAKGNLFTLIKEMSDYPKK